MFPLARHPCPVISRPTRQHEVWIHVLQTWLMCPLPFAVVVASGRVMNGPLPPLLLLLPLVVFVAHLKYVRQSTLITVYANKNFKPSLHFAWGVAEAKCILITRVCVMSVCLPVLAAFPQYCTDPDISWGMVWVPCSCALLGALAIGTWISLLWQHSAEREMSPSACSRSMPGYGRPME